VDLTPGVYPIPLLVDGSGVRDFIQLIYDHLYRPHLPTFSFFEKWRM
jgi:hypothetical protein